MRKKLILFVALCFVSASLGWAFNETEPNDTMATANGPLSDGVNPTGTLLGGPPPSNDYYRMNAVAGDWWYFTTTILNPSLAAPLDLGLQIRDSGDNILQDVDLFGGGGQEDLDFYPTSTATYYLVVYEATGTPNTQSGYRISIIAWHANAGVTDWTLY